jgi:predicted short-subunit dehydrogenase-like oxidoreductase (DUF2520 family)
MKTSKQTPRVGIFGLGRAGGSLFLSCREAGIPVVALGSRSLATRQSFRKTKQPGIAIARSLSETLRHASNLQCSVFFLAVPDNQITPLCRRLGQAPWLPGTIAHLSGARGTEPILRDGVQHSKVGSFHPLASLPGDRSIPNGALLAIHGQTRSHRSLLKSIATQIGLKPVEIRQGMHAHYHLAASFTANLSLAPISESIALMKQAGIPKAVARQGLSHLLRSLLVQLETEKDIEDILTGPIPRGDTGTIEAHLEVLSKKRQARQLYQVLTEHLLAQTHLTKLQQQQIKDMMRVTLD